MNVLVVPYEQNIGLGRFWDTAKHLKLFIWINIALISSCITVFANLPTSITALLYFTAAALSVWIGVLRPVEGLACYFSLSFYTALPVVITGSSFSSSLKDVLLVVAVALYLLTINYRVSTSHRSSADLTQSISNKNLSKLPILQLTLALFIILTVVILSILFLRYQDLTLLLLGFRAYFFYFLVTVVAYNKLHVHLIPLFLKAITIAALYPSLIGILQVIQFVWSPRWLPPLVLFSEDKAKDLFQGNTGVGIVQESLELIRTPATLTGVPQFACLNIITGIALITLISLALVQTLNGVKIPYRQWFFLLLLSVFFFVSTLAGGNRMPIAVLLVISLLSFFTLAVSKQKINSLSKYFLRKKKKASKAIIVSGFTLIMILVTVLISIYVINLLPEVYTRYIGSIGYQINIRLEVLKTQVEPIFQFSFADHLLGVGPATQSAGARYLNDLNANRVGADVHAESQLLQQMVELGIIFFPMYFLPRVILVIWSLKKLLLKKTQPFSGCLIPLTISFGVLTVVPYGNFITLDPMNAFYWLIGGLLLKFTCKDNSPSAYIR